MTDQLIAFTFVESNSVSIATIGPKFDQGVEKAAIIQDFLSGLDGLCERGDLSKESGFVIETKALLVDLAKPRGKARRVEWKSEPSGLLERQIQLAIRISLGENQPAGSALKGD